jgi:uncharacterized protein YjbI with pentapeptide repeats
VPKATDFGKTKGKEFDLIKTRLVIFGIAGAIAVGILLTLIMANTGVDEPKAAPNFANGQLELIGEPYSLGDMIQIRGKVNDPNIDFVTIEVLDEKNNVMDIVRNGVYDNGNFQQNFESKKYLTLDEYWDAGTYTARVTAEGVELSKSFEILDAKEPKQVSTEISAQTRLELTGFLESGQVYEFNALRNDIAGFLLLEGVDASGVDLSGINLEDVGLPEADLRGAIFDGANFHKAKLLKANLQNVNLDNLDLSEASLENANLQGASLQDARLENAWLVDADLTGANLHGAYLKSANLRHAILQDVNLKGADLTGATLDGANMQNADLENAILKEAYFYNTNLEGVKNLPIPIEKAKAGGIMFEN